METLIQIYSEIGPFGIIIIVVVFILMKSRITFEFPRKEKEQHISK